MDAKLVYSTEKHWEFRMVVLTVAMTVHMSADAKVDVLVVGMVA
jgi:hypothetical protein